MSLWGWHNAAKKARYIPKYVILPSSSINNIEKKKLKLPFFFQMCSSLLLNRIQPVLNSVLSFLYCHMAWRSHNFLIDPEEYADESLSSFFPLASFFFHVFFLLHLFSFTSFFFHVFFLSRLFYLLLFYLLHLFYFCVFFYRTDYGTNFWTDFCSLSTLVLPILTVLFH